MANKKLTKSADKKISGVLDGLAEYFDVDVTLVRVAYVFLTIFTCFAGVICYIIMAIIIPNASSNSGNTTEIQ